MQPLHIQVNLPSSSSSTAFPLPLKSWSSEDSYEVVNYNEVQFPDFRHIKRLGRGSYGTVVQCFFRGRAAAAKLVENGDEHSQIRTEAELLHGFRHKNIIKLYALFHGEMSGLVLELMEGGSLHELLHQHLHITYQACHVLNWALQVGEAISYLHAHNFIHRDIKPSNMLLSRDYKILKLCDFGTVAELRTSMTDNRGTAAWMAPEVFRGKKYGQKCDIFSLGISLWEIITRRQPFTELNENPLTLLWKVAENGLRPPRIQDLPEPLMDLIERCWANNPDERPCLEEVQKTLEAFLEIFPNANLLPLVDRTTHRQAIAESPQKQPGQHFWPSQQHQTTPPSGQQQQTPPHFPPPTISVPVQHHQQSPDHSLQPFFPQIPSSPQPLNQLHPTHHNQHIIVQTHRRRNSHDSRFLQLPTHPFQQMESSSPHSSHSLIDIPGLSNQHTQHSYYYRPAVNSNNNGGGGGPYNPCLSPPMHPPPDIYGPPSQPNVGPLHRSITLPPSHVMDHQNESEWQQNGDASPKHPGKKHKKRGFFGFRFRL